MHHRLAERALREAWPTPEERQPELVAKLVEIAVEGNAAPRERVDAVKSLLAASKLALEAIRVAIEAERHEDLVRRVKALEDADDQRGGGGRAPGTTPPAVGGSGTGPG